MERPSTVMLRDKLGDSFGQSDLFGQLRAVGDVAGNNLGALCRAQSVVGILALLVLDKIIRRREFPNVVVERANPSQQRIGGYGAAGVFRQLTHGM